MYYLNKNLSQIILINKNFINFIISLIKPIINSQIIEIGFGYGALSFGLIKISINYNVILNLIEIDYKLCCILINKINNINIFNISILDLNFFNFINKILIIKLKLIIIGNLPYKISSPILYHLLNFLIIIKEQYFMLQFDLARKLKLIKNKSFNKISIILNCYYKINFLFKVDKKFFFPKPSINSAFLSMKTLYLFLVRINDLNLIKKFLNLFFINRRKTLKYIFLNYIKINIDELNINLNLRCEQISIDQYIYLFYNFKIYNFL